MEWKSVGAWLALYPEVRDLVLAYSGGLDSHVLLHLLATHRHELAGRVLKAVYIDHGLQPASFAWGRHCQDICRQLRVEFQLFRVDARPRRGESPEAAARRARYQTLRELTGENDALLTAQHQDDQAETVLLQLLRGAGSHGLAAMPRAARFGKGWLLRPLLSVERAEILAYAESHDLCWVEDATNADRSIDRNFIRHEIMPLLKARWPAAGRSLGRSARWCAETARLADVLADRDLERASVGRADRLNIQVLRTLDEARRRNTLRRWFRRLGLPSPNAVHLDHIVHDAIFASHDRTPVIHWPGAEVRRYRELLYAMPPLPAHDAGAVISIQAFPGDPRLVPCHEGRVVIPGIGRLSLLRSYGHGIRAMALAGAALTARFRQGGERSRPAGRRHSQNLKKLLQAAGVPPWERERLPLLYVDESLAAVADLWVEAGFSAGKNEPGMVWEWQKASPFDNV